MKGRIKALSVTLALSVAAIGTVLYSSCSRDKCSGIVCAYDGVCDNGVCICEAGYEGNQCETINRDRYEGTWVVKETGTRSTAINYSIVIQDGPTTPQIRIKNFRNFLTDQVIASVVGDTMTIEPQVVNGYTLEGVGYFAPNLYYANHGYMELRYSITDPAGLNDNFGLDSGMVAELHK